MTTLVTGANGFVGSALARQLLQRGHEVKALVRPGSDRRNLENLDIALVEGDLTDAASLKRAVSGCRVLFHVAADYRLWIPRPRTHVPHQRGRDPRVAARRPRTPAPAGSYIPAAWRPLASTRTGPPPTRSTPVALGDMVGHYKRSKFLAEQAVRELVEEQGLPAVIVNPSTPVGPARRQAHAHRPDYPRYAEKKNAGLRGHGN